MPIFEYRCDECGRVTAFLEKAGRRKHACEACESTKTTKALSSFATRSSSCPDAGTCTSGTCPMSR